MERQAEEIFAHLDEFGDGSILEGCIKGIEENWFQGASPRRRTSSSARSTTASRIVVGVNRFTEGNDDDEMELLEITNEDEQRQLKRLDTVRHDRNQRAVDGALARSPPRPPTPRST
jgi:methylmalonyl-CoA mutase N-terminal domain/subunit